MRKLWIGLILAICACSAMAQNSDESAIRAVLTSQAAAWNRGDIKSFMQGYENSPETTFIGTQVRHGYEPILDRYMHSYTSRAQMGTLTFRNVAVRLLPDTCGQPEYAIVTGHFHLERTEKGSTKKDDGIFSLVWRKGAAGWKIVLDHTS